MLKKFSQYRFMFEELVKRDFKKKYKRTVLGMGWSVLSPLLQLLVMRLVFTQFFGNQIAHYTTYLFCGNLIYSYFRESTNGGMSSLMSNASIFTKINVPKYLFLLSKNMSSLINFGLTLCVFFVFALIDGVSFDNAIFETLSALCTVGLTTGITATLSTASCLILIVFMFFGRVGIMTISVGFMMANRAEERIAYAQTRVMIG